jgi:putative glutamine amidotransferase
MMRIGLTYTGTEWKHENYVKWLIGKEEDIEIVRLSAEQGNQGDLLDCSGLVLSGGVDIEPGLYGGYARYHKAPKEGWQKERDLFEQSALRSAWEMGLPVLGVCRGLQLINVSLKGSLVQDLGGQGDEVHENESGVDKQHAVRIERGTMLAEVAGQSEGVVNSAHHQAVDRLGEGMRVNCRAEDGTIEGLEWAEPGGKPFMLAVQWHPERMYVNGLADAFLYQAIRDRFIEEIKKNTI